MNQGLILLHQRAFKRFYAKKDWALSEGPFDMVGLEYNKSRIGHLAGDISEEHNIRNGEVSAGCDRSLLSFVFITLIIILESLHLALLFLHWTLTCLAFGILCRQEGQQLLTECRNKRGNMFFCWTGLSNNYKEHKLITEDKQVFEIQQ